MVDTIEPQLTSRHASLSFIKDLPLYQTEKPYNIELIDVEGQPSNLEFDTHDDVVMHDVRGNENLFNLRTHGFSFLKRPSQISAKPGTPEFIEQYLMEGVQIIQQELGTEKVIGYDLRVRKLHPLL